MRPHHSNHIQRWFWDARGHRLFPVVSHIWRTLVSSSNLSPSACLWTVGGSQSIWRNPTRPRETCTHHRKTLWRHRSPHQHRDGRSKWPFGDKWILFSCPLLVFVTRAPKTKVFYWFRDLSKELDSFTLHFRFHVVSGSSRSSLNISVDFFSPRCDVPSFASSPLTPYLCCSDPPPLWFSSILPSLSFSLFPPTGW